MHAIPQIEAACQKWNILMMRTIRNNSYAAASGQKKFRFGRIRCPRIVTQWDSSRGSAGASVNATGSEMVARRNSRFSLAMKWTLIDFGQTASHSY